MRNAAFGIAVAMLGWAATVAQAASPNSFAFDDYQLATSGDLLDVCTLSPGHEHYAVSMAYCAGYFQGGAQFHDAVAGTPEFPRIACAPQGTKLEDLVNVFVAYAKANPQYLSERPMETVFRAVVNKWPCGT